MTLLIVWASIIIYLSIGWLIVTPKLAVTRLRAMTEYKADKKRSRVLATSVVLGLIWPVGVAYVRASNAYDKSVDEEKMLEQVRREIEQQKREVNRRSELELEAFERALKEKP